MTSLKFPKLTEAIFIRKANRFVAIVNIDGTSEQVHIPSTGRLDGILIEGATCYLKPSHNPKRKTQYTLFLVEKDGTHICIDSLLANTFVHELLLENQINGIQKGTIFNEVQVGSDRLDFVVQNNESFDYIEVKSVNKCENGVACFPDAPTERGRKHVASLITHQKETHIQSHIIFVIQRNDASMFTPCYERDIEFANLLNLAYDNGVHIHVCLTNITEEEISFEQWLPVQFR